MPTQPKNAVGRWFVDIVLLPANWAPEHLHVRERVYGNSPQQVSALARARIQAHRTATGGDGAMGRIKEVTKQ